MAQGRQAKILSPRQETAILRYLDTTRYPQRDRTIFLLSIKAGMRAREIAAVTWAMVTDADGQVDDTIALENRASKGTSGRLIPRIRSCTRRS
jgi:integrase/recombinase XerD